MKRLPLSLTLLFICLVMLSTVIFSQEEQSTGQSGDIIVRITGFDSNDGEVRVALYNSNDNYQSTTPFVRAAEKIVDHKVEFTFKDIPFGEYAIKCYHDENLNGKMDRNSMGIPVEAYGFSNNAVGNFGPAKYEDAKFTFNKDKQVVEIKLQ
ncbi:MAG: DUF2141 domain-containing protein [Ignavibacteriaceae bacterium]